MIFVRETLADAFVCHVFLVIAVIGAGMVFMTFLVVEVQYHNLFMLHTCKYIHFFVR